MLYALNITTSANTTQDAPQSQTMAIALGTLKRVLVRYRYGSADLCGIRCFVHETQVFPFSPKRWFISMPELFMSLLDFDVDQPPFELRIETYNEDDTYPHDCAIYVDVAMPTLNERVAWLLTELQV